MQARKAILGAVAVVCLLAVGAGTASALLIEPVGDPIEGNSWGQRWRFSVGAAQSLSQIDIHWCSPSWEGLEKPATWNLSQGTWSGYYGSRILAWFKGPAITDDDIELDLWYTPECVQDPFEYDVVVWHGWKLVDACTMKWDSCWTQCECNTNHDQSGVPEPASCALLALAVGGIGVTLRRRRNSR